MNSDKFEASAWDRELDSQLETKLRKDAANWSTEPSAASTAVLQASLTKLAVPEQQTRRVTIIAAAALLALGLGLWSVLSESVSEPGRNGERILALGMCQPLQLELDAVTADANAIAAALLEPLSGGFFALLVQNEMASADVGQASGDWR